MTQYLRQVFTEQTSPIEVAIFMAVTVVVCLLLAATVYLVMMLVLWAFRLRGRFGLLRTLLPSSRQFTEYLAEYLLASATSILLAFTLMAKHDLVQQIKNLEASDFDRYDLADVFPLHTIPNELKDLGLIRASTILKAALEAGQTDEARLVVKRMIEQERLLEKRRMGPFLVAACGLLILLYLSWMGWQRSSYLLRNPQGTGGFKYTTVFRRLLVLAICVALLLASPTLLSSADGLAESTLAVLQGETPQNESQFRVIYEAIGDQFHVRLHDEFRHELGEYMDVHLTEFHSGPRITVTSRTHRVSDFEEAILKRMVDPIYPVQAMEQGISGRVRLEGVITETGEVKDLVVLEGPQMLRKSAIEAVSQWLYEPPSFTGKPVSVKAHFEVVYTLKPAQP